MLKNFSFFLYTNILIALLLNNLSAAEPINKVNPPAAGFQQQIMLNNRILARVNNKPITVMDVMKKMDLFIYRELPSFQQTLQARYQFYKTNWHYFLQDMMDEELIMADAREKKMVVTTATVREELEKTFGPDVRANIAKLGLAYQEAWDIFCKDLTVERMLGISNWKADVASSPALILSTYYQKSALYQKEGSWTYQVISFRHTNSEIAQKYANEAYSLLSQSNAKIETFIDRIKAEAQKDPSLTVNISKEIKQTTKEIAPDLQKTLNQLEEGQYSSPTPLVSRAKQEVVYRIFYLKERKQQEAIKFENVEHEIKSELTGQNFVKEKEIYLSRLRNYFSVEDFTKGASENFEPFIIY